MSILSQNSLITQVYKRTGASSAYLLISKEDEIQFLASILLPPSPQTEVEVQMGVCFILTDSKNTTFGSFAH